MNNAYDDVGFRIIRIKDGHEPAQKVELATLDAPQVTAALVGNNVNLSWTSITEAVEYQIFEYDTQTNLFKMLNRTTETSFVIEDVNNTNRYKYVVQAVSYVKFSNNVSFEYCVSPN